MITRRHFGKLGVAAAAVAGVVAVPKLFSATASSKPGNKVFEITKTEEEWKKLLTPEQFYVLRKEGTEYAFSSPLDKLYDPGTYHCAGCDLPVYLSDTKYDSGTGWPSFWAPIPDAIGTKDDRTLFLQLRTEVHCRRCGGHLGHVFDDGPKPTGLRYCMNGIAMKFVPKASG